MVPNEGGYNSIVPPYHTLTGIMYGTIPYYGLVRARGKGCENLFTVSLFSGFSSLGAPLGAPNRQHLGFSLQAGHGRPHEALSTHSRQAVAKQSPQYRCLKGNSRRRTLGYGRRNSTNSSKEDTTFTLLKRTDGKRKDVAERR